MCVVKEGWAIAVKPDYQLIGGLPAGTNHLGLDKLQNLNLV